MGFSNKRGRPKTVRSETDMGTPELQKKRANGLTLEAIDLCLSKNLITQAQHWCALHLRWLYTLRYGAPGVSSTLNRLYDMPSARPDDPLWRSAREAEFAEAVTLLRAYARYEPVAQLAIFNERPRFLDEAHRERAWKNNQSRNQLLMEYQQVTEGLTLLQTHWKIAEKREVVTNPQQP